MILEIAEQVLMVVVIFLDALRILVIRVLLCEFVLYFGSLVFLGLLLRLERAGCLVGGKIG